MVSAAAAGCAVARRPENAATALTPSVAAVWTPTPDDGLRAEIQAALARPRADWIDPPRPVAHTQRPRVAGWLWGRQRTQDGTWLGLATLFEGTVFDGAELHWYPAEELRTLD
jgi:hypothetical protein